MLVIQTTELSSRGSYYARWVSGHYETLATIANMLSSCPTQWCCCSHSSPLSATASWMYERTACELFPRVGCVCEPGLRWFFWPCPGLHLWKRLKRPRVSLCGCLVDFKTTSCQAWWLGRQIALRQGMGEQLGSSRSSDFGWSKRTLPSYEKGVSAIRKKKFVSIRHERAGEATSCPGRTYFIERRLANL